jgi:hypothetical protein
MRTNTKTAERRERREREATERHRRHVTATLHRLRPILFVLVRAMGR